MSEEIKEIPLKERIEKLLESGWVNEFNYLESQLQEARSLVVILQQKVEQLENIRKEAIKYVENNLLYTEDYDYDEEENLIWNGAYDYKEREDLLNILNKGSESNELQ